MIYRKVANWFNKHNPSTTFKIFRKSDEELPEKIGKDKIGDGSCICTVDLGTVEVMYEDELYPINGGGGGGGAKKSLELSLSDPANESISGTATNQSISNKEIAARVKELKAVIEVDELPETDIDFNSLYNLTEMSGDYETGCYYNNGTDWVRISDNKNAYSSIEKVKDYLYNTWYDELDEQFAKRYFEKKQPAFCGYCSSMANNKFTARNFDWVYNEQAGFIVNTPNKDGRLATIGVSGAISGLDNEFVGSEAYSYLYKIVPYMVVDGMNEKGLSVSTNIVDQGHGDNAHILPSGEPVNKICTLQLPRFILDKFDSADSAIDYITGSLELYTPKGLIDLGYCQQFLISDKDKTYILEFNDGDYIVVEKDYMTNFYLADVSLNEDGSVYTPETQDASHDAVSTNNITEYGNGLERYNLINENFAALSELSDFQNLLEELKYTNSYLSSSDVSDPFWYTDYVNPAHSLKTNSPTSAFTDIVAAEDEKYQNRSRDEESPNYGTWQSVHSCVYDKDDKKLHICVQEDGEWLTFKIPSQETETSLVVKASENQTINGYSVPKLTAENIEELYNAFIDGTPCFITDATGNFTYAVKQADTDTSDVFITYDYFGIMVLTHALTEDEEVSTSFTKVSELKMVDLGGTNVSGTDLALLESGDVIYGYKQNGNEKYLFYKYNTSSLLYYFIGYKYVSPSSPSFARCEHIVVRKEDGLISRRGDLCIPLYDGESHASTDNIILQKANGQLDSCYVKTSSLGKSIVLRNEYGKAEINDPDRDMDIANKKYVDIQLSKLKEEILLELKKKEH